MVVNKPQNHLYILGPVLSISLFPLKGKMIPITPCNSPHLSATFLSSSRSWHLYHSEPVNQSQSQPPPLSFSLSLSVFCIPFSASEDSRQTAGDEEFLWSNSLLQVISHIWCHWFPASPFTQSLSE